jgi:hypothetical protein
MRVLPTSISINKILIITIILGISFGSSAEDATIKQLLRSSDAVIWAGLDYSMVRVIGNSDTIKVPKPDFPKYA